MNRGGSGAGTKKFGKAGRERSGEPKILEKRGGSGAGSQNFWKSGAGADRGVYIFGKAGWEAGRGSRIN